MSVVDTYWVKLFFSGPIEVAKQALREECAKEGLCVTVEPVTFIYTGGEEVGYVVGLINYPRFPAAVDAVRSRALSIAETLLERTHQASCSVMTPTETYFLQSKRIKK